MIVNTKNTGLLITGTVGNDPELKHVGQYGRAVLKLTVRYGSEMGADGKRHGKFLDVDIWDGAEDLDGMLAKGDPVIVTAPEVKSREYNGKTYNSVSADGVFPGASVVFRWMQQVIDMIPPPAGSGSDAFVVTDAEPPAEFVPPPQPAPQQMTLSDTPAPGELAGHELYPGETLTDYAPGTAKAAAPEPADAPIADDEDLPF